METKLIELRDRATFIPAIATLMLSHDLRERYLLARAGFSPVSQPLILLGRLEGDECHYDPYDWQCDPWRTAHQWLMDHWAECRSGDVIDAEFLRGESKAPKESERIADLRCD